MAKSKTQYGRKAPKSSLKSIPGAMKEEMKLPGRPTKKATSPKQVVPIGLPEARRGGAKVARKAARTARPARGTARTGATARTAATTRMGRPAKRSPAKRGGR
jgi:hypothetical protein